MRDLMGPLELIYYLGYIVKKRYALPHQNRLPDLVVSVGNITLGGTGKTPATIALAEEAKKRGFSPVVLTRGYKGKAKSPCFISKGTGALLNAEEAGDEPLMMANRLSGVPIVKCASRYDGGTFALASLDARVDGPFLFVLDDGFQHWNLFRNVDIVLIDGSNPFGNRKMFPVGPLREPLTELRRADVFVITKARNDTVLDELNAINPQAPVFFGDYKPVKFKDAAGNAFPLDLVLNKRLYAFCGIANPESFKRMVQSLGGDLCGFKAFRDHYNYKQTDSAYLASQGQRLNCDFLIATEKDMVKLNRLPGLDNLLYLAIEFCVASEFFDCVFSKLV
ncbi:MAG: tetraacyldisaccharide 4'-kinase [Dissulfurispiraceae bacterium]